MRRNGKRGASRARTIVRGERNRGLASANGRTHRYDYD